MKRKISLLLAIVMILSLVPMSAFAASTNEVDKVPKVADDHKFDTLGTAPELRITEKNENDFRTEKFWLTLENAEWRWNVTGANNDMNDVTTAVYGANAGDAVSYSLIDDTTLEVTMSVTADAETSNKAYANIPMLIDVTDAGDVKVTIDQRDSKVSGGTYTIAVASGGATVATADKSKNISRGEDGVGAKILIDETAIGAIARTNSDGTAKLHMFDVELPSGFKWDLTAPTATTITFDAGFDLNVAAEANIAAVNTAGEWAIEHKGTSDKDQEVLRVAFVLGASSNQAERRTMTLNPVINTTKDADLGDVKVDIRSRKGDVSSASDLKVAAYYDFSVSVSVEEVKTFLAGRVDEDYETAEIEIKEQIANSIIRNRVVELELPEWAQVVDGKAIEIKKNGVVVGSIDPITGAHGKDTSKLEWKLPNGYDITKAHTFTLVLPLTFAANKTGDVELTVSGAGIEEQTVKIAKVIAPVTAEVKVADVKVGLQGQSAPDIIITEVEAGALIEDQFLLLDFANNFEMAFDEAKIEVIKGDLKINDDKSGITADDKGIEIFIDRDSQEASTIKISGIKMTLDRSVPEGPFNLAIKGRAVVQNGAKNVAGEPSTWNDYSDTDFPSSVASFKFANVVTRAGGTVASTSKFVIGSTTYKVTIGNEEVEKTMDVAAFIQDGRTFLPIRFVAEALGVSTDNIIWNNEARTVTIMKGDRVAQMVIGSNVLTVNGVAVPMDTAAMIKDGRTVLPVRYVAQALGAEILWDAATQTVTVNQ